MGPDTGSISSSGVVSLEDTTRGVQLCRMVLVSMDGVLLVGLVLLEG